MREQEIEDERKEREDGATALCLDQVELEVDELDDDKELVNGDAVDVTFNNVSDSAGYRSFGR